MSDGGKGSKQRPTDLKRFRDNYDKIFNKEETKMSEPEVIDVPMQYSVSKINNIFSALYTADDFDQLHLDIESVQGDNLWGIIPRTAEGKLDGYLKVNVDWSLTGDFNKPEEGKDGQNTSEL